LITKAKQQKLQLRQKYLPKRASLAKSAYGHKASETILEKLQQLELFKEAKSVLLYYPAKDEVDIRPLLGGYLNNHYLLSDSRRGFHQKKYDEDEQKKIYLPSIYNLSITLISKDTRLKTHFNSIKEPVHPDSQLPEQVDLAVIPGVVFDEKGYRIGHGGGWYDRLFSKVRCDIKIGLSFDELVIKNLPVEAHDQKVDIIITDKRIIDLR